jgi:hypothetical protein
MSREYRRFEILLPLRFNDGAPIPEDAIGQTLAELQERFGAVSSETRKMESNSEATHAKAPSRKGAKKEKRNRSVSFSEMKTLATSNSFATLRLGVFA